MKLLLFATVFYDRLSHNLDNFEVHNKHLKWLKIHCIALFVAEAGMRLRFLLPGRKAISAKTA
jgi:hypothetical protein